MNDSEKLPLPSDIPRRAPGFLLEELDDELLLFNPDDGRLLELNSTAALVWQLCDGARRVAEIDALLAAAYPESAADIAQELPHTLANLAQLAALSW